jgi:hypothetical protein
LTQNVTLVLNELPFHSVKTIVIVIAVWKTESDGESIHVPKREPLANADDGAGAALDV